MMPAHVLKKRLKELESSAQQTRLEAMRVGAVLLAKMDTHLANEGAVMPETGELAALKAHHELLMRLANDAQAKIDKLHAELHDNAPLTGGRLC